MTEKEGYPVVTVSKSRLESALAGTHAVIDLDVLAGNVVAMRQRLPESVELMAVVKANAYGHGSVPSVRAALSAGADQIGVARIEEGLVLREAGITAPLLVLGPPNPLLAEAAAKADLILTAGSDGIVEQLSRSAASAGRQLSVHLKVDTGMHRYGLVGQDAVALGQRIAADPHLRLDGIFTHFAAADLADDHFTREQIGRFEEVWSSLKAEGIKPPRKHLANSAAAIRGAFLPPEDGVVPLVRMGSALYGLSPSSDVPVPEGFRPVLTLKSRLSRVFSVPPGGGISYGLTYVAKETVRCATLPLGYADGLSRSLSNRGWVVVNGVRCPIRGRVCMDQLVIGIDDAGQVQEGDEAIVIGDGSQGEMTADDAAALAGTINYEVVASLQYRVPRVYRRGGRSVAVSDLLGLVEFAEPV